MACRWILLGLAVALTNASAGLTNELANPGLEQTAADRLTAWTPYGRGYALEATEVQSGKFAVCCETAGDQDGMGIAQVIRYDQPDNRPIIVGGWSKAEHVGAGGDYCLYLSEDYLAPLADAQGYEVVKKHVGRLVKTMTDFTRDPAALAAVRDEIADQIEMAGGARVREE